MNKLLSVAKKAFDDMEYKNKTIIPEFIKDQLISMYGEEYIDQFEPYSCDTVRIKDTNFYMSHNRDRAPVLLYRRKNEFSPDEYSLHYDSDKSKSDNLIKLHKGIQYLTEENYSLWTKFKLFFITP
jgi:hypothetical protein